MGRDLIVRDQYTKTKLEVRVQKEKDIEFFNLDEFCKELYTTRVACREGIGLATRKTVTMIFAHYGFHSEYYLYNNIGKLPNLVNLKIELSGFEHKKHVTPKKFGSALDKIIPAHESFISFLTKLHNEINITLDLINSPEPYQRNQMVSYATELNKAAENGLIMDKNYINILRQFNDIRNLILHEEGRLLFHLFSVENIRSIIQCCRICRVILKKIVMDNFDKFNRNSDKDLLESYKRSLNKAS